MFDILWPCVDFTVECEYRVVEWLAPLLLSGSAVNTHIGPKVTADKGHLCYWKCTTPAFPFLYYSVLIGESSLTWYSISASLSRKPYHQDRNSLQELLPSCCVLNSPNIDSDYAFRALEVETSQTQKKWTVLNRITGMCYFQEIYKYQRRRNSYVERKNMLSELQQLLTVIKEPLTAVLEQGNENSDSTAMQQHTNRKRRHPGLKVSMVERFQVKNGLKKYKITSL